jgi:hypothetical protein
MKNAGLPCFAPLRSTAVDKMCDAFKLHVVTLYLILVVKLALPSARTTTLVASFCSCLSIFCLSERFWGIQGETPFIWSPRVRCMFSVSRWVVRALSLVMVGLWAVLGWRVAAN